eukprot:1902085-Amphidinium_carterae.2
MSAFLALLSGADVTDVSAESEREEVPEFKKGFKKHFKDTQALSIENVSPKEIIVAEQAHDIEVTDDTGHDTGESSLARAADKLSTCIAKRAAPDYYRISKELGIGLRELKKRLYAAAEALARTQASCLEGVLHYIECMAMSNSLDCVGVLEYASYDETPLLCNVTWGQDRFVERARMFVLETQILFVLKRRHLLSADALRHGEVGEFFTVLLSASPTLRPSETCTGEGIVPLLEETSLKDACSGSEALKNVYRIVEVDEAGANTRAEKLLSTREGRANIKAGIFYCSAHKVHKSVERLWELPEMSSLLSGLVHSGLLLLSAQSMKDFGLALQREISTRPLRIFHRGENAPHPPEVALHRVRMVSLFGPPKAQPRRYALCSVLSTCVLNGDWRGHELQHVCTDKCAGRCSMESVRIMVQIYIAKCLKAVRPQILQRGDWKNWPNALKGYGLFEAIHGLMEAAFRSAFQANPAKQRLRDYQDDDQDAAGVTGHDVVASDVPNMPALPNAFQETSIPAVEATTATATTTTDPREETAEQQRLARLQHRAAALQLLDTGDWFERLTMLMQGSIPELDLMWAVLGNTAASWEQNEQAKLLDSGVRAWRALELHKKIDINSMLQRAAVNFQDATLLPRYDNESNRTLWFKSTFRSAACVYQLLSVRVSGFPWRLLSIIEDKSRDNLKHMLDTPPCMLDDLSASILTKYNTIEALSGNEVHHLICGLGQLIAGTTKSVDELAMSNLAWSGPSYLKPPVSEFKVKEKQKVGRKRKHALAVATDPPAKRRGGGGAWRAFTHYQTAVTGAKADWAVLKEQYRTMKAEDPETFSYFAELGKLGLGEMEKH